MARPIPRAAPVTSATFPLKGCVCRALSLEEAVTNHTFPPLTVNASVGACGIELFRRVWT